MKRGLFAALVGFCLLMASMLVGGCGKNPMATNVTNIVNQKETNEKIEMTFEELVLHLDSPKKIINWMSDNRKYDEEKTSGWGRGSTTDDKSLSLAKALYNETGLICGNFAGFFVYCMKAHGFNTGGLNYLNPENNIAHSGAWYMEGEKVKCFSLPKLEFKNRSELITYFNEKFFIGDRIVWTPLNDNMINISIDEFNNTIF